MEVPKKMKLTGQKKLKNRGQLIKEAERKLEERGEEAKLLYNEKVRRNQRKVCLAKKKRLTEKLEFILFLT